MKHAFKISIKNDLFVPGTIRLSSYSLCIANSFLILSEYIPHSQCEEGETIRKLYY